MIGTTENKNNLLFCFLSINKNMERPMIEKSACVIESSAKQYFQNVENDSEREFLVARTVFNEVDQDHLTFQIVQNYLQKATMHFKSEYEESQSEINLEIWTSFATALRSINGRSDINHAITFFNNRADENEQFEKNRNKDGNTMFFGVFDLILGEGGRKFYMDHINTNLRKAAQIVKNHNVLTTFCESPTLLC